MDNFYDTIAKFKFYANCRFYPPECPSARPTPAAVAAPPGEPLFAGVPKPMNILYMYNPSSDSIACALNKS